MNHRQNDMSRTIQMAMLTSLLLAIHTYNCRNIACESEYTATEFKPSARGTNSRALCYQATRAQAKQHSSRSSAARRPWTWPLQNTTRVNSYQCDDVSVRAPNHLWQSTQYAQCPQSRSQNQSDNGKIHFRHRRTEETIAECCSNQCCKGSTASSGKVIGLTESQNKRIRIEPSLISSDSRYTYLVDICRKRRELHPNIDKLIERHGRVHTTESENSNEPHSKAEAASRRPYDKSKPTMNEMDKHEAWR